jgi:hypothetical protein
VGVDPTELAQDHPDVLRPLRHLDAGELFERDHVAVLVRPHREVIGAVEPDHRLAIPLDVAGLAQLFGPPVEVADERLDLLDALAGQGQHHPEHPVRAGMLRAHVDGHLHRIEGLLLAAGERGDRRL